MDRFDRQLRIAGWKQENLERARVAVIGDEPILTSLFILSSAALGLNRLIVIAPTTDSRIINVARKINPNTDVGFLEGYFVHPSMNCFLGDCKAIVDLTSYGLANKLSINRAFLDNIAIFRGYIKENDNCELGVFTYTKGKEWEELAQIVSLTQFPRNPKHDPVFSIILSGIVLEELTRYLMDFGVSDHLITYRRKKIGHINSRVPVLVVGAGALGNFVALGLALCGFRNVTFIDPDIIETSNLNRQVFFYNSVGENKAEVLARRLSNLFRTDAKSDNSYFDRQTDISGFDIVFDCVDNFETRIIISEKCKEKDILLISGGTGADAGQVVVYDPAYTRDTPAETLGLYGIVDERKLNRYRRQKESCVYRPEPSVIMTNQIIAGFMVDLCRQVLSGHKVRNIFYYSDSPGKI